MYTDLALSSPLSPPQNCHLASLQGHCWVLADNPELEPPHVIDSRSFGPLPFSSILGRVMYSARSEKDHGPVENSPEVRGKAALIYAAGVGGHSQGWADGGRPATGWLPSTRLGEHA